MCTLGKVFVITRAAKLFYCSKHKSVTEKLGWRQKLIVLEQTGKTSRCRHAVPTSQEEGRENLQEKCKLPVTSLDLTSNK